MILVITRLNSNLVLFMFKKIALLFGCGLIIFISGCVATSTSALRMPEGSLQSRQIEMRQFDTKDELKVLSATVAVLQDMGFTLNEVEKNSG